MANVLSILVIGQGSIGLRHREILSGLGHRAKTVSRRAGVGDFDSIAKAIASEKFDAIVISSETAAHVPDLLTLKELNYRGTVLVEKPLCSEAGELRALGPDANIFVAYNLRFLPIVQELRAALAREPSQVVSVHLEVAQAIDTWRPGRSREGSYTAFRHLGGGVLRDLSHELDLAIWLFGPVVRVTAIGGRYSEQTVDSDDAWSIMAECRDCPQVTIAINGIDKNTRRAIKVTTAAKTYHADLVSGVLHSGADEKSVPAERNDSYRMMLQALLAGGSSDVCTFVEGVEVMQLIAAIEASNQRQCWVKPTASHE